MWANTDNSYGVVTKTLHWLLFLLVLFMLIFGYFLQAFPSSYKHFASDLHKQIGFIILSLMMARFFWAIVNPKPWLPPNTPFWQQVAERVVHWLLYFVLIAMPVSGWIGSSAAGKPPHFFGYALSLPISMNKWVVKKAFEFHDTIALVIIAVVGIHVLAAFYHYFFKKDRVLQRMLPDSQG